MQNQANQGAMAPMKPPPPPRPPPPPPQVLFFGEFTHPLSSGQSPKEGGEVDEVKFREAVIVRILQAVRGGEAPTAVSLPSTFRSVTQPDPFFLEIFCKDLNNPRATYMEQLLPRSHIAGGAFFSMPKEVLTNHLILRGTFQAMSVVISGTVIARTSLSPAALQGLTSTGKPTATTPAPTALVPPPPPRPLRAAPAPAPSPIAVVPPPPPARRPSKSATTAAAPPPLSRAGVGVGGAASGASGHLVGSGSSTVPVREVGVGLQQKQSSSSLPAPSSSSALSSALSSSSPPLAPTGSAGGIRRPGVVTTPGASPPTSVTAAKSPQQPPQNQSQQQQQQQKQQQKQQQQQQQQQSSGATQKERSTSSLPQSWTPLVLPTVGTAKASATQQQQTQSSGPGGMVASTSGVSKTTEGAAIAPADLSPYGEAGLAIALSEPPERMKRRTAESNPFDERLLVPAAAARRLGEAISMLTSLSDEGGAAGIEAEVPLSDFIAGVGMYLFSLDGSSCETCTWGMANLRARKRFPRGRALAYDLFLRAIYAKNILAIV